MVQGSPIIEWSVIQAMTWIPDKIVRYSDHFLNTLPGIWITDFLSAIQMVIWIADFLSVIQMPGNLSGIGRPLL